MTRTLICIFLMFLVTYLPRVLPITIFRKEIKSDFVKSFLHYVPYAVLASLTFPDIFSSSGNLASAILGTIVAVILALFERSLVLVAVFSMLAVFLSQFIF